MIQRKWILWVCAITTAASLAACGGSTATSSGSNSTGVVSSLTDLPDLDTMVEGGATANANIVVPKSFKTASGTPPLLRGVTAATAKDLFWYDVDAGDNIVDMINTAGTATEDQQNVFWSMEGSCRMAQTVGFAVQNLKQAGTSSCYMKNMPDAVGADALTVADGAAALSTPSAIFDKQDDDFVVRVNVSNFPVSGEEDEAEASDQIVYIKVFGNNSLTDTGDYSVDLWFCDAADGSNPRGYETVRYDASAGTVTKTNQESSFGSFTSTFTANVTTDADGNPIFDTASDRVATNTFSGTFGAQTSLSKSRISVSGNFLYAQEYNTNTSDQGSGTNKNYAIAEYTGDDMSDLRFIQAGYTGESQWSGNESANTYSGGTEYQTDHYEPVLIADMDADLQALISAYDMSTDTFFDTAPSTPTIDTTAYVCNPTVSYTIAMDYNEAAVAAVAALCEQDFQNMNFCDDDEMNSARQILWNP